MMKKINLKYLVLVALFMATIFSGGGKVAEARFVADYNHEPSVANSGNVTSESASSDGRVLYAYADNNNGSGTGLPDYLFKSIDGGLTWNPITSLGLGYWDLIVESSDGLSVAVAVQNVMQITNHGSTSSYIYVSNNGGTTWATSTAAGSRGWSSLSMSSSGTKIIGSDNSGYLYYSTTTGSSWATSTNPGSKPWESTSISADGSKIFATQSKYLYSSNDGINFSSSTILTNTTTFGGVNYLGGSIFLTAGKKVYYSSDNGSTWSSSTIASYTPLGNFGNIYGSQDGRYIYVMQKKFSDIMSVIYYSKNGGLNWVTDSLVSNSSVTYSYTTGNYLAVSSDGTRIYGNGIVDTTSFTTPLISSISTSYSTSSASVSWNTDKLASSSISYGLASNVYTASILNDAGYDGDPSTYGTTTHSFDITSLLPCTTYNYKYDVTDIYENPATSPNYSFKTSGCIANTTYTQATSSAVTTSGVVNLGNLRLTIPSGFSATTTTAQFEATELATSTVITALGKPARYNLFNSLYQLQAMPTATSTLSTFTNPLYITLTYDPTTLGVTDPSTLTIFSTEGAAWSQLSSCVVDTTLHTVTCPTTHFSTFGIFGLTIPASITNTAVQTAGTSATISWNTDKGATTGLNYGINNSLTTSTTTDSSFTATVHSITLPNLTYGTTYYYQIVSTDIDSNTSTTSVMSFTTSADPSTIPTASSVSSSGGGSYPAALFAKLLDSSVKTNDNLGCAVGNLFNTNTGRVCGATNGITNTPASTPSSAFTFTKDLKLGMKNNDVLQLQKFLNNNGFIVAKTGAGSQGKETTYFGPATKSALIKFQKANKVPGTGYFGGMTRNAIKTKVN